MVNTSFEVVNREQEAAWNGHEGDVWTERADDYDRASGRILERLLRAGVIGGTDRVLDVGCGTGKASRQAARIAAQGSVVGIDLSARMLQLARKRAAEEALANVDFVQGDAQVFPFEAGAFDVAISSFGGMFFEDAIAAYKNVANAVRPGGTLAMLAWRSLPENEWLVALRSALAVGRDLPMPPPDGPTPFSLADPERVTRLLTSAGFAEVTLTPIDEPIDLGADATEAYAFAETMGIVEGLTGELDADLRSTALANLAELLRQRAAPSGVLLDSAAWLITARRR